MALNILVFLLSLCMLPLSISVGVTLFLWVNTRSWILFIGDQILLTMSGKSKAADVRQKRILLTGDNDDSILALARVLHSSGHAIYVVKQEPFPLFSSLWPSNNITAFIGVTTGRLLPVFIAIRGRLCRLASRLHVPQKAHLPIDFTDTLLRLIDSEKIDLWIPCDAARPSFGSSQARNAVLKHSACHIVGPSNDTLKSAQGYANLAQLMQRLESGIHCPRPLVVRSRAEIHEYLSKAPRGQRYIVERSLQPQKLSRDYRADWRDSAYGSGGGSSDSEEFESAKSSTPEQEYVVLPLSNTNETYHAVAMMTVSNSSPWIMHEVIEGRPGTISALVVQGRMKAFAARTANRQRIFSTATKKVSPTLQPRLGVEHNIKEWQEHESTVFLDPMSTIGQALLHYANAVIAALPKPSTTHINLHFFLTDRTKSTGAEQRIVVTGCDFSFTSVLTQQAIVDGCARELGNAYAGGDPNAADVVLLPSPRPPFPATFRSPFTLQKSVVHRVLQMLRLRGSANTVLRELAEFMATLALGHEILFDRQDPVPWLWYWMVQKPFFTVYRNVFGTNSQES